jgi:hypothetical protein
MAIDPEETDEEKQEYTKEQLGDMPPEYCTWCGGTMAWCASCEMWTKTCCEDYGTCQCS